MIKNLIEQRDDLEQRIKRNALLNKVFFSPVALALVVILIGRLVGV